MTRRWRTTDSIATILLVSMATVAAAAESQAPNCTNTTQIDLCFLIDRSGSICDADPKFNFSNPADTTCDNWAFVVNFVYRFVTDLYIGPNDVRVAVVIFDNSAHLMWNLTGYLDKGGLLEAINTTLGYEKGQTTNTSDGLNLMADQVFNEAVRPGALRTAIIITDGKPTNVTDAYAAVDRVHSRNITTFVVGVTNQIDQETLKRLSSPPQEQGYTYFIADTYSSIDTVRAQVLSQTCLRPTTTTPSTTPTTTTTTPKTTIPNPNATSYSNASSTTPDPNFPNPSSIRSTPHYTPTISTDFNPYISGLTSTSTRTQNDSGTLSTTSNPNLSIPSTRAQNNSGTLSTTSNPNLSIPSTRTQNDSGTLSTTSNPNLSIPSTGSGNPVPNNYSAVPSTPPDSMHNSSSGSTNSLNANTASVPSVIAGNTHEPNGGGALTDESGIAQTSSRATTPGPPGAKTTEMTTSAPRDDGFTFANVGPLRGPIAGGTAVTISGSWPPDNVSVTAVYIGSGIRGIVTEVNRLWGVDEILFLTPPTDQVGNLLLEVQFSGYYPDPENYTTFNVSTDRYFAYSDNPRIWEVFPREHLVSGGTMLTAVGSNLTSIGYAAIQAMVEVCRFSGNGKPPACSRTSRTRPCVSSDVTNKPYPTELICKMPQIDLPPDFLDILDNVTIPSNVTLNFTQRAKRDLDSTLSIHLRRKRSTTTTPGSVQSLTGSNGKDTADIYLRFILDGFQGNELTTILQDTRFYFFSAPEINSSHAVVSFNPDEEMTIPIQGKHMQRGCTREDYMVRLGKSNCTITSLTDNQLTCSPPEVQPENTNEFDYKFCDLRYTIIVSIGDKIYFYRCLEYTGPNSAPLGCPADCWNNSNCWWKWKRIVLIVGLVIGLVLLLIILILIICLIVTCRRNRRQRRMEAVVSRGRNQMRAMGAVDGSIGGNHAALNGAKSSRGSISMEYLTAAADEDNEDADRISTGSSVKTAD